jgi:hypothetical protein
MFRGVMFFRGKNFIAALATNYVKEKIGELLQIVKYLDPEPYRNTATSIAQPRRRLMRLLAVPALQTLVFNTVFLKNG